MIIQKITLLWLGVASICCGCGITDLILPAEDITLEELAEDIDRGNTKK